MNDMRPKYGPSPESPASIEEVESRLLGPGFLAFVLNSLVCKGGRNYSGLEYGFIERIAGCARAGGMN